MISRKKDSHFINLDEFCKLSGWKKYENKMDMEYNFAGIYVCKCNDILYVNWKLPMMGSFYIYTLEEFSSIIVKNIYGKILKI